MNRYISMESSVYDTVSGANLSAEQIVGLLNRFGNLQVLGYAYPIESRDHPVVGVVKETITKALLDMVKDEIDFEALIRSGKQYAVGKLTIYKENGGKQGESNI